MASPETRSRWLELGITIGVSILASALTMAWTVSGTLSTINASLENQAVRLKYLEDSKEQVSDLSRAQSERLAVQEAKWSDVLRRLDSIDRKLEAR